MMLGAADQHPCFTSRSRVYCAHPHFAATFDHPTVMGSATRHPLGLEVTHPCFGRFSQLDAKAPATPLETL